MRKKHTQYYSPSHPLAGRLVENLVFPFIKALGSALKFYDCDSHYATQKGQEMRERLGRGESVYLIGMGPSGHNSTAALVKISASEGILPICNNEEERYTGIRHEDRFPEHSLRDIFKYLEKSQIDPEQILAVVGSWDYLRGIATSLRVGLEETPHSILLARKAASPQMNPWHFIEALRAPSQLKRFFRTKKRVPFIGMRHHDNHAYFPYAVSPFARTGRPTMIVVIDGFGDDGAMSTYIARGKEIKLVKRYPHIFDSLGLLYAVISSTQGGWTTLSSEGRFMGATAWGDTDRLTNPFYKQLRQIVYLGPEGNVSINRSLINYHRRGQEKPYSKELEKILGAPIPPEKMWNPGTVLRLDDIELTEISRERVDKAAALQMVFEDALFHIVDSLIKLTKSHQLVLSGGTSLNCLANMKLLEHFDEDYFKKQLKTPRTRLHLWVPPNPSDTGAGMGACYHFALRFGADLGPAMRHAFICGSPSPNENNEHAIKSAEDTESLMLGNIKDAQQRTRIADLVAYIISNDGILGLFQGASETGPRALGHRTILANPCNPKTLEILNAQVKYRENFRPLAPMLTMEEAKRLYDLSDGASDSDYNAYNYMVLTVRAKPEAYELIPAVIHRDGTSRIQIVREETDPFSYAILKAMGKRLGVEVAVNTSLNVGTPIVQTPKQAINALHRSKGLAGLLLAGSDGKVHFVWHNIKKPPKDAGYQLKKWIQEWRIRNRMESNLVSEGIGFFS
ncbi:MAG: carbamoyltransferase C-terminal domain-containing protein [Candidatus Aminicenantes bacterium]|jgi:carbamoyltransferase